jgi:hypothetical protein
LTYPAVRGSILAIGAREPAPHNQAGTLPLPGRSHKGKGGIEMTVKISTMTGKLRGVPAINTSPLDNPFCEKMAQTDSICAKCYSRRMVSGLRKNCRPGWKSNGQILSERLLGDAEIKDLKIPEKAVNGIFRFSAHGELINEIHAWNLIQIARVHPDIIFALWTKRPDLLKKCFGVVSKPENLVVIYSNPAVDSRIPVSLVQVRYTFVDKVFNVISKDSADVNCGARSCATCKLCYSKNTTSEVVEKLK